MQLHIPCAELARRYTQQEPLRAIAASYGCSPSTIARRLSNCGITQRGERRLRSDVPQEALRQLYLDDRLPLSAIAQMLHISRNTVTARLRLYNIPARHNLLPRRSVVALWRSGLSIATIAELMSVRTQAIVALTHQLMQDNKPLREPPLTEAQQAYLSGLRRSWMRSERTQNGITVYVATNDAAAQQLFLQAFADYRPQRVYIAQGYYVLTVQVPGSWGFLHPETDQLPNWIRAVPELIGIFLAGLFDGAGGVSIGPAPSLVVDAPWPAMLEHLAEELQYIDQASNAALQQVGSPSLWRLQITSGVQQLLGSIAPHLRHRGRRRAVYRALRRR
jgi:hypothetical protein